MPVHRYIPAVEVVEPALMLPQASYEIVSLILVPPAFVTYRVEPSRSVKIHDSVPPLDMLAKS